MHHPNESLTLGGEKKPRSAGTPRSIEKARAHMIKKHRKYKLLRHDLSAPLEHVQSAKQALHRARKAYQQVVKRCRFVEESKRAEKLSSILSHNPAKTAI